VGVPAVSLQLLLPLLLIQLLLLPMIINRL
jgi:hypothetical protein